MRALLKTRVYLESSSVWYDPKYKVNIVAKQNISAISWWLFDSLAKNNPLLNMYANAKDLF